jgi:excisionase family DNA binding protein
MENGFITPQEISNEIGVSINYVYNLIKCKGFPSLQFGKKRVVPRKAWENFISNPQAIAEFTERNGSVLEAVGNV